ncbi:MAG: hypothetical protein VKI63_02615 [Cyanobium sp.]|nr:hypothetical protein [Cyanobium sp.]
MIKLTYTPPVTTAVFEDPAPLRSVELVLDEHGHSLADLAEHVRGFFVAAGYHPETVKDYLGGRDE